MSTDWTAGQLIAAAQRRGLNLTTPRYNPRPAGVICEGSATHAVYVFLQSKPNVYFSLAQLIHQTGRTKRSVDFGVAYLRQLGLIDAIPDTYRSTRYLRYSLIKKG